MANRVLLGQGTTARGGTSKYGLWVSRPGKNVLSCSDDELIFDMDKGGGADIKGMFQLQTVTGTATAFSTDTVTANSTATISFTNFNWANGIVPFIGLGVTGSGPDAGQTEGAFTINSFSTSGVNVTNLLDSQLSLSFSVMPFFSSNARF